MTILSLTIRKVSFKESSDEGTGDEIVEILARFRGVYQHYGQRRGNQRVSYEQRVLQINEKPNIASRRALLSTRSMLNSRTVERTTSERSESLRKDVRSGDVTNYEVMLMKGYSANVDITADDAGGDTPFLELMCRCLPEPAR